MRRYFFDIHEPSCCTEDTAGELLSDFSEAYDHAVSIAEMMVRDPESLSGFIEILDEQREPVATLLVRSAQGVALPELAVDQRQDLA